MWTSFSFLFYIGRAKLTSFRASDKNLGKELERMIIGVRDVGDVVVFDIEGEIRRSDSPEATLHQLVKARLESGRRNVLLNFEKVEFIDSFGVGEILASFISTQNMGGRLKLAHISRKLHLVFQVTMLTKVLEIFDTVESALRSYAEP
jgi:anti-sigma B factor antagonist